MQGRFDGMSVEVNEGKLAGSFDIPDDEGDNISYDTTFVFVVTATAGKSTFDLTKTGDVKRLTQFDMHDVIILSAEEAEAILTQVRTGVAPLTGEIIGQLSHDDYDEEGELVDNENAPVDMPDDYVYDDTIKTVGRISQTKDDALANFLGV